MTPAADVRRRLDFPRLLLVAHVDAGAGHRPPRHRFPAGGLVDRVAVQAGCIANWRVLVSDALAGNPLRWRNRFM